MVTTHQLMNNCLMHNAMQVIGSSMQQTTAEPACWLLPITCSSPTLGRSHVPLLQPLLPGDDRGAADILVLVFAGLQRELCIWAVLLLIVNVTVVSQAATDPALLSLALCN